MQKLYDYYKKIIIKKFMYEMKYHSIMQVPKIIKIVLNMGVGEAVKDKKLLDYAINDMRIISSQQPLIIKSKKSIAAFKIRKGYPIGCKVTLRKKRMWDFFERLIFIAIPRIRDFRGFSSKAFDGYGNYSIGIKEQIIFPEINHDTINRIRGMDITINTNAKSDKIGLLLLSYFNFPFRK